MQLSLENKVIGAALAFAFILLFVAAITLWNSKSASTEPPFASKIGILTVPLDGARMQMIYLTGNALPYHLNESQTGYLVSLDPGNDNPLSVILPPASPGLWYRFTFSGPEGRFGATITSEPYVSFGHLMGSTKTVGCNTKTTVGFKFSCNYGDGGVYYSDGKRWAMHLVSQTDTCFECF